MDCWMVSWMRSTRGKRNSWRLRGWMVRDLRLEMKGRVLRRREYNKLSL